MRETGTFLTSHSMKTLLCTGLLQNQKKPWWEWVLGFVEGKPLEQGVGAHTCNLSPWKAEARELLEVSGYLRMTGTLFLKKRKE